MGSSDQVAQAVCSATNLLQHEEFLTAQGPECKELRIPER